MRAGLTTIHAQACMQTVDLICQPTLGAQRFLLRGILYCRVGAQQPARRRSSIAFGRFDHRTCQLPRRRPPPEPSRKAIIGRADGPGLVRSEEHTSELQSLMRMSYAVFCLKTKTKIQHVIDNSTTNNQ